MDSGRETRTCLMKSSKGPRIGSILAFGSGVSGEIREILKDGRVKIAFSGEKPLNDLLEEEGSMPLPPYIRRNVGNGKAALDRDRYQTVYAGPGGAVAAPTAGLHFTPELIESLNRAGVGLTALTLHVGYGTFQPVRTADIRSHRVGVEFFRIGEKAAGAISRARNRGGRIVAVGTTVVRALETAAGENGGVGPYEGKTGLTITPGFRFRVVDALITNFHLPRSSLLFLVCAFAGREKILNAYRFAVSRRYRFYSYGDAMFIA
jgi:S-adenosylmethionine:tRNA ribosyltransferase-isomerase